VRIETYAGRHVEAEATLELARPALRQAGDNGRATHAVHEAWLALRTGNLRRAGEAASSALLLAGDLPLVARRARLALAEALTWAGRDDEAEAHLLATGPDIDDDVAAAIWRSHVVGLRLLHAGDPTASDHFEALARTSAAAGIQEPCHDLWADHAVRAHLAAGRADRACDLRAWLDERARELSCPWPAIAADLAHARVAADRRDRVTTVDDAFRRALDRHDRAGLPLQRTEALTSYGAFLRRRGRSADAREVLLLAETLAADCGASALRDAARSELAVTDRRRGARGPALTSGERRVAELASEGRPNAAIARSLGLSVNTVETHLKHAYAKLGITSRRALRQVL
jgi:DNA-binding CsgD family transcriptional regulator